MNHNYCRSTHRLAPNYGTRTRQARRKSDWSLQHTTREQPRVTKSALRSRDLWPWDGHWTTTSRIDLHLYMTARSGNGRHRWLFHQHKAGALRIILAPRVQEAVSVWTSTDRWVWTAAASRRERLPVNQTHRTASKLCTKQLFYQTATTVMYLEYRRQLAETGRSFRSTKTNFLHEISHSTSIHASTLSRHTPCLSVCQMSFLSKHV